MTEQPIDACCPPQPDGVGRRRFLTGLAAIAGAGALQLAAPTMAFAGPGPRRGDLLVVVSLRGGADGLTLVPPLSDRAYATARPAIGVRPGQALPLDRTFGLHPQLEPLLPWWRNGSLAVVHAVGSTDESRSHFKATSTLERGGARDRSASGWIDRHLTTRGLATGDFPAFAVGTQPPIALRGPAPEVAVPSVDAMQLHAGGRQAAVERALRDMHAHVAGPAATAGRTTLDVLSRLAPSQRKEYVPRPGATYPAGDLGHALRQVAKVARAGIGLEVACVDSGGWDTHTGMGGAAGGPMSDHVARFGQALSAFARDLGPLLATTTLVTVSEFGRRVAENGSGGVDHGYGNAMLLLGGGVRGGKVYGRWPGLGAADLDSGDLRVTTDYRDVLGEVVRRRLGNGRVAEVFPGHRLRELGVVRPR